MNRKPLLLLLSIVACLAIAVVAYIWATGMMDSMYAYRSPLATQPPAPGAPSGDALTRRVVFVLIDGLRTDTAADPQVMPFLNELRSNGASAIAHSQTPSYSAPGYTVLFTGAWPELSDGPPMNLEYEEYVPWTQDNLFSAAQRAGLATAISGYNWFEKLVPQDAVAASYYTAGEDDAADQAIVAAALPWLHDNQQALTLIHLLQVDYAGHHEGGPQDPRWNASARRADDLLRAVVGTLDLTQDTVVITSDHGHIERGGHGGPEPIVLQEPLVLAGAGIKPGVYGDVQQVDIAPTLATLLGAAIPAAAQGHVLTETLALPTDALLPIQAAAQAQQQGLAAAYSAATGETLDIAPGGDPVTATQAAIAAARAARARSERLPRLLLALAVVGVLGFTAWRTRSRALAWMVGAAVIYALLFNLKYALLDGRTYSLSSVASAGDLIAAVAMNAALAALAAWLVLLIALRLYRQTAAAAAQATLNWTLTTIALVGLPALLSFVINGALVTWTLPEPVTYFLGFLAAMQMLVIAAVGLLLAGLAAIVGAIGSRRARPASAVAAV